MNHKITKTKRKNLKKYKNTKRHRKTKHRGGVKPNRSWMQRLKNSLNPQTELPENQASFEETNPLFTPGRAQQVNIASPVTKINSSQQDKPNRRTVRSYLPNFLYSNRKIGRYRYNNEGKKTKKIFKNIRFNDGVLEFYDSLTGMWIQEYYYDNNEGNHKYLKYTYNAKTKRYDLTYQPNQYVQYYSEPSSRVLKDSNRKIVAMRIMIDENGKPSGRMYQYKIKSKDGSATFKLTLGNEEKILIEEPTKKFRLPRLDEKDKPVYVIDKINGEKVIELEYDRKEINEIENKNNKKPKIIVVSNIVSIRNFSATPLMHITNLEKKDQLYYNYKLEREREILTKETDDEFTSNIDTLINGKAQYLINNQLRQLDLTDFEDELKQKIKDYKEGTISQNILDDLERKYKAIIDLSQEDFKSRKKYNDLQEELNPNAEKLASKVNPFNPLAKYRYEIGEEIRGLLNKSSNEEKIKLINIYRMLNSKLRGVEFKEIPISKSANSTIFKPQSPPTSKGPSTSKEPSGYEISDAEFEFYQQKNTTQNSSAPFQSGTKFTPAEQNLPPLARNPNFDPYAPVEGYGSGRQTVPSAPNSPQT
jgi:hypothetical protein